MLLPRLTGVRGILVGANICVEITLNNYLTEVADIRISNFDE